MEDVQGVCMCVCVVHSLRFTVRRGAKVPLWEEQMVLLLMPNTSSLSEHLSDRWAQDPGPKLISSTPPLKGTVERPASTSTHSPTKPERERAMMVVVVVVMITHMQDNTHCHVLSNYLVGKK